MQGINYHLKVKPDYFSIWSTNAQHLFSSRLHENLEIRLNTKTGRIKRPPSAAPLLKQKGWCIAVIRRIFWQWYTHTHTLLSSGVCASKWADRFRMMADEWGQAAWGRWIVVRYLQQTHVFQSNYTPAANGASDSPAHTHTHTPHRSVTHPMPTRTPTNTHGHAGRKSLASNPVKGF